MKNKCFALPGAVCLAAVAAFTAPAAGAAEFRMENGMFYAACAADAHADNYLIDTGADIPMVRDLPPLDKYPSRGKTSSKGVSGEVIDSRLIRAKELRCGELRQSRVQAAAVPVSFPHSVLGLNFFTNLKRAVFDFQKMEFRSERPSKEHICSGKLAIKDKLLQVPVTAGGAEIMAAWDTAASLSVADMAFVQEHPEQFDFVRDIGNGQDSSLARVTAKLYTIKALSVCGRDLSGAQVVAVDLAAPRKAMPDFPRLFLGANLMMGHVWAFDFKTSAWSFQ